MDDRQAKLAAEMARHRVAYLDRTREELTALAELAKQLNGETGDSTLLEALYQRLHKLAGSGGTFGLPGLSKQARLLEQQAESLLHGEISGSEAYGRLAAAVAALPPLLDKYEAVDALEVEQAGAPHDENRMVQLWLVDDDESLGQELRRSLKQFGYEVRLFSRLGDAEEALDRSQPDALIMDIEFAEEEINATEAMLKRPAFAALSCPILFVTAHSDFASRLRAVRIGAKGFLPKPLDIPKLVDLVEHAIKEGRNTCFRVLIVDDDLDLSEHYRLVLTAAGMDVEVLNQPEKIIERVAASHPEMVLMDMYMPGYSGPELAAVIRQYDNWIGLPIVYLSAETDPDRQIQAMGIGADDFLTKPIPDARLVEAVKVRAARARQLSDLMFKDSLTGLLRHARIKEELELQLARAQRSGAALSVVMVDIDHFKMVNDTYGHAVGDRVIRAIAHLLKQRLRKSDIVGRYGGEEFAAILPDCDAETAEQIMDDVRERFATLRFHHDGAGFSRTLSAGIACSWQHPNADSNELLIAADGALYRAKHGGRNRVQVA